MKERSITDAYGMGTHTFYTRPDKVHMYCTIQCMNCALQGRRQLHAEVGRLGSYWGYDTEFMRYEFMRWMLNELPKTCTQLFLPFTLHAGIFTCSAPPLSLDDLCILAKTLGL